MTYLDAALSFLEPMFGGWLMVALAVAFVFAAYGLVWLVLDYRDRAALSRELRQVQDEREQEERKRLALERIMHSTERYRNLN